MSIDPFEYDVALSFARADKSIAEEFANLLARRNITVFLDEVPPAESWGNDPVDHIVNLYARKARYCVLVISSHYPLQQWTNVERSHARERALRDADEYILLLRIDDHEIPGIADSRGNRDLREHPLERIVEELDEKLRETKQRLGPPSQSHDLRSGNVPSSTQKFESS